MGRDMWVFKTSHNTKKGEAVIACGYLMCNILVSVACSYLLLNVFESFKSLFHFVVEMNKADQ